MSVLTTIVETILLCGCQNVALCGHRDVEKYHDMLSNSCWNFRAFLDYRINGGDEDLRGHCEPTPRNATYKSKRTQNKLINISGALSSKT